MMMICYDIFWRISFIITNHDNQRSFSWVGQATRIELMMMICYDIKKSAFIITNHDDQRSFSCIGDRIFMDRAQFVRWQAFSSVRN
jgi:hypothetical protein